MLGNQLNNLNKHILRQALDAVQVPVLIISARPGVPRIVYANAPLSRLIGYSVEELHARDIGTLTAGEHEPGQPWVLRSRGGREIALVEEPLYEQPGRASYWMLTLPTGASGQLAEADASGLFTATGSWTRRDERTDGTTGIPGRAAFLEVLTRDWALARREERQLSVVVFRVDEFDSYQAVFGRHAADACLRKVAHGINNSLRRATDYCARVGHDEFAVLITGIDEVKAGEFGARIVRRVRELAIHHPRSSLDRYVTVSSGVSSELPARDATECCLLEDAEARVNPGIEAISPAVGEEVPDANSKTDDIAIR